MHGHAVLVARDLIALLCVGAWVGNVPGQVASRPASAPAETVVVDYHLILTEPEKRELGVIASISGLSTGRSALKLGMNVDSTFVRLERPLLAGPVRARTEGHPLVVENPQPYEWVVKTGGRTSIELRYSVPLTHRELDAVRGRDEYEFPHVSTDHAFLPTGPLIIAPADVEPAEIHVRVDTPAGWPVHAPWPAVGERRFALDGLRPLQDDLLALGNWHTETIAIDDFTATLAIAPGQQEVHAPLAELVRQIVTCELKLFGRPPRGRYLFIVGPPLKNSLAGSPKTSSMVLALDSRLLDQQKSMAAHLVAHEFFHTWAAAEAPLPDELRWINEGFTDYYAYLVCARLKLIEWDAFAATLGQTMQEATYNPLFGKLSLVAAGGPVFFENRDAYDLVYDGGLVMAAWLDRAIRHHQPGRSLDDFMRALLNDPRWDAAGRTPTLEDVTQLIRQFVPGQTADHIITAATGPYQLNPVAAFVNLGVFIERERGRPALDLRANLDGTRLLDLDPRDYAHRFGLRPGDVLLAVNGQDVTCPTEVHAAWRKPIDEVVRVRLRRGDEELVLEQGLPVITEFKVPVGPWLAHRE